MKQDKDSTHAPLNSVDEESRLNRYTWLLAILWTAMVVGSWSWNLVRARQGMEEAARIQARETFQMDLLYRRWNAMCGGVYAQVSDWIPPNPYLEVTERDIQIPSGRQLTLVNPAYMTRLVHELGKEASGIQGHITSLNPIRPENAADQWEEKALQTFEQGESEKSSLQVIDGILYMRLMRPLLTEESCLQCHAVQGYKLGDIRGGISISVPMASLQAVTRDYEIVLGLGHGGLWLLCLIGLFWGRWHLVQRVRMRQQAEEALRESAEKYRGIFDESVAAIYVFDAEKNFVDSNPAGLDLLGYSREELLRMSIPDVDADPTVVLPAHKQLLSGERIINYEHQLKRKDGRIITVLNNSRPFTDAQGNVVGIQSTLIDITERKQAEEELEKIFNLSPDMICVCTPEGKFLKVSPSCTNYLGYTVDEILELGWSALVHPDDVESTNKEGEEQLKGSPVANFINRFRGKDGTYKVLEWQATPAIQGIVYATARDITARKRMEQELIRTQRLRALGELSAGFCHNFNNILTSVMGPAQLLKRYSDNPQALRDADDIITGATRARDLVQQLNRAVRGEQEGELYPVSVNEVVQQAVHSTRPRWKDQSEARGIAIEVFTELEDVPSISGNASELNDLLFNLLFNAVDAMPEGGTITFRTQTVEEGVQLTVTDTGKGVDEETRRKVFEPFFTTKMDIGTGLGLTTVHGTVTRWGGSIDVESTPGQGTTFTLRFPVWTEPEVQEEEKSAEEHQVRSGKLLIVEDDEGTCGLLCRLLGETHEVETVLDGWEALERFAPGQYDVVLIDLGMPGLAGDQVAREMMRLDPAVVTVLITGWLLKPDDPRKDIFDFQIEKPFDDLDEVEDVVARAIELHDQRAGEGN